ncbi:hypothetical protein [Pyrodictium abyssi]|uniref:Uncharacterized protein n=1 Tax=Pyrodictium abyssi TaxID=54256 RepID=A0ABM8IZG7_9CREN|nr:hypothetical protein PABY_10960 [Pyrodictium abyssi]
MVRPGGVPLAALLALVLASASSTILAFTASLTLLTSVHTSCGGHTLYIYNMSKVTIHYACANGGEPRSATVITGRSMLGVLLPLLDALKDGNLDNNSKKLAAELILNTIKESKVCGDTGLLEDILDGVTGPTLLDVTAPLETSLHPTFTILIKTNTGLITIDMLEPSLLSVAVLLVTIAFHVLVTSQALLFAARPLKPISLRLPIKDTPLLRIRTRIAHIVLPVSAAAVFIAITAAGRGAGGEGLAVFILDFMLAILSLGIATLLALPNKGYYADCLEDEAEGEQQWQRHIAASAVVAASVILAIRVWLFISPQILPEAATVLPYLQVEAITGFIILASAIAVFVAPSYALFSILRASRRYHYYRRIELEEFAAPLAASALVNALVAFFLAMLPLEHLYYYRLLGIVAAFAAIVAAFVSKISKSSIHYEDSMLKPMVVLIVFSAALALTGALSQVQGTGIAWTSLEARRALEPALHLAPQLLLPRVAAAASVFGSLAAVLLEKLMERLSAGG